MSKPKDNTPKRPDPKDGAQGLTRKELDDVIKFADNCVNGQHAPAQLRRGNG